MSLIGAGVVTCSRVRVGGRFRLFEPAPDQGDRRRWRQECRCSRVAVCLLLLALVAGDFKRLSFESARGFRLARLLI